MWDASQTAVKVVQFLCVAELWKLHNSYGNCSTDSCESCAVPMGIAARRAGKVVQFLCELHHRQLWKLCSSYGNCSTESWKSCTIPMRIASQTAVKVVQFLWELQHRQLWKWYNSYWNCSSTAVKVASHMQRFVKGMLHNKKRKLLQTRKFRQMK